MASSLVQAQYWHDPLNEDLYKTHSLFLADINQELVSPPGPGSRPRTVPVLLARLTQAPQLLIFSILA